MSRITDSDGSFRFAGTTSIIRVTRQAMVLMLALAPTEALYIACLHGIARINVLWGLSRFLRQETRKPFHSMSSTFAIHSFYSTYIDTGVRNRKRLWFIRSAPSLQFPNFKEFS